MKNPKFYLCLVTSIFLTLEASLAEGGALINDHAFSVDVSNKKIPACSSSALDTDGDGWGWENAGTCHVGGEFEYIVHPICQSTNSDPDGDGWGWENNKSCIAQKGDNVQEDSQPTQESEAVNVSSEVNNANTLQTNFIKSNALSSSSAQVEFELKESGPAFIQYGFEADDLEFRGLTESNSLSYHRQVLKNLEENQKYFFIINSNGLTSEVKTFTTLAINNHDEPVVNSPQISAGTSSTNNFNSSEEPFASVPTRTSAVNSNIFGGVPKINGKLPAQMPIGVPFDGPVPGTEYIRISSANGNGTHYYSTKQVWNADMTKVMIGDGVVDANRILDATNNFALLPQRINLNSNRLWSNVDPDIIYGMSGNTLYKMNVSTGAREVIYKRPNGATITFNGKVSIPDDDSKMVFMVQSENRIVSIDLQSSQVPRPVLGELDWTPYGSLKSSGMFLTYGQAGKYIQIRPPGTSMLYRISPDLKEVIKMTKMCCHSDTAYDTNGESIQAETIWKGRLRIYNFDTLSNYNTPSAVNGQSGSWFPSYVSGRGQKGAGRGWVVMSGEEGEGSPNHPLILFKADGNQSTPTFKALGGDLHSGTAVSNQYVNAGKQKAVQSPDGNAVAFDSDGGVPGGELSTYILRVKN